MTGAPTELEPNRQDAPQGKPDLFTSPTEGQRRAAAMQRRKRIGKHLSEALIAAVVGGVVTIMVWQQATAPATQTPEIKPMASAAQDKGVMATNLAQPAAPAPNKVEIRALHGEATTAALTPNKDQAQTTTRFEPITLPAPTQMNLAAATPTHAPLAANTAKIDEKKGGATPDMHSKGGAIPAIELMDDAVSAELDPLDEPGQAEAKKEHDELVPVIKAKAESQPTADVATKVTAQPKSEAKVAPISAPRPPMLAQPLIDPKPAPAPIKAEAKTEAKTEAKAAPAVKSEAKATATTHADAKSGFPSAQPDGLFLVTAGSYANAQGAEKIQKKLTDAGIPVRLRKSLVNNHAVHHLLTGPFANVEIATQAVATIKARTGIEARYVTMPEANPQAAKSGKSPVTVAKPASSSAVKESVAKETAVNKAAPAKAVVTAKAAPVAEKEQSAPKAATAAKSATPTKEKETTTAKAAPVKAPAPAKEKEAVVAKATPAAPVKSVTVTAKAVPAKETASKPRSAEYVAIAGSFTTPESANQMRRRLTEQGIASYTKVSSIEGKEYTHVMVGPFASQQEADQKLHAFQKGSAGAMAKAH
ncbi:MAG: hypothetical protein G8237_06100 [Magnetococcales bacterium]|nr:SPOR domain-containing protein [Magnetococcales bacterium]NGZ05912.1 hypothetical protein [Magnetococcales bacterium]